MVKYLKEVLVVKITKENYKEYFDGRTLVLPPETTEITEMAVFGSDRLVTLDLSNVTSPVVIGKRAFMRCDNLVNIKVPNGDFKIIINKRGFGLTPLKTVFNDRTTRGVMHPEMLSEISTSNGGVLMLYSNPEYSNTIYGVDQVKPKGEEVRKGKASGMKTFFKKVLG